MVIAFKNNNSKIKAMMVGEVVTVIMTVIIMIISIRLGSKGGTTSNAHKNRN